MAFGLLLEKKSLALEPKHAQIARNLHTEVCILTVCKKKKLHTKQKKTQKLKIGDTERTLAIIFIWARRMECEL